MDPHVCAELGGVSRRTAGHGGFSPVKARMVAITAQLGHIKLRPPAATGTAAVEVSHLTKSFGGRTAVDDVSFSVARGEVFGFLGPNGAGKPNIGY
jgi:ATPase subunit of ABC transporter with duplicated ATPase domains